MWSYLKKQTKLGWGGDEGDMRKERGKEQKSGGKAEGTSEHLCYSPLFDWVLFTQQNSYTHVLSKLRVWDTNTEKQSLLLS